MIRRVAASVALALFGVALAFALLEIWIRLAGSTDADGQFRFLGYDLEPYALPVSDMRQSVEEYIANQDKVTIIYDADTGWVYRPKSIRHNGSFTVNGGGIRSTRETSQTPLPDTLRIALFGDSFTADPDVRDEDSWSHLLQLALNQAGIRAETLNFGVGGYGMDQAYLRWRKYGRAFQPDIVIFGFQPENLDRNLNIFRLVYKPGTSIPLAKPRFILFDSQLQLINSPVIAPEAQIAIFESFADHPLARYEAYHSSADPSWWTGSRLLAFVHELTNAALDASDYGPDSERGELGKAIVDAFALDVAAAGADFIIAHLPLRLHLVHLRDGGKSPFAWLQDYFAATYTYVPLERQLLPFADRSHFGETEHYSAQINRVIASALADAVEYCIENSACGTKRFADGSKFLARRE